MCRIRTYIDRARGESGSITVLDIGVMALCLVLIFLGSVVYSSMLIRARTQTVADAAALVGAGAYDFSDISIQGFGSDSDPDSDSGQEASPGSVAFPTQPVITLDSAKVQAAVDSYLSKVQLPSELELKSVVTVDKNGVAVTLGGVWHPPFVGILMPQGILIVETATARTYFR